MTQRKSDENKIRKQGTLLQAINKLLRDALDYETEQDLARNCLSLAENLTASKFGFIGEINPAGRLDTIAISDPGWESCAIPQTSAPLLIKDMEIRGIWASVFNSGKPQIINDPSEYPGKVGLPKGHPPISAFLGIPLQRSGKIFGLIALANKEGGFAPADVQLVELLSAAFVEALDRRRSIDSLIASEDKMRGLIDNSPFGIGIIQHGKYCYVNPELIKILGYDGPEQIIGAPAEEFVTPEDRGLFLQRYRDRLLEKSSTNYYEAKGLKKNGNTFEMDLYPRVIEHNGEPAVLVFMIDKSEEKSLRAQLGQAQKMEAIGTLAGGVAHDFNNLLQIIAGYSELLPTHEELSEKARSQIEAIAGAGKRGAELVKRLLTFSRKSPMERMPLSLNSQIAELHKMLSRTIPKMIEIRLVLAEDLYTVNADPTQIDQVLMNLAVNSRDAMPDGGRITIQTQNVFFDEQYCSKHLDTKPGPYVQVTVSDTGQGMSKETLEHIFEPFFSTKGPGKGTGLGLATVYGIVKQHGGRISCSSEPGQGTSFRIYLPALEDDTATSDSITDTEPVPQGGDETILLVDDEEVVINMVIEALTDSGYTVLTAANGIEALELYKREEQRPAIVILDLIMPEIGGKECLRRLLEMEPKVKVIIASGVSPESEDLADIESQTKGVLRKPYKLVDMLRMIREVLNGN